MKCVGVNSGLGGKGNTFPDLISGIRLEELKNTIENLSRDSNCQNYCLITLFSGIPTETADKNPHQTRTETLSSKNYAQWSRRVTDIHK